MDLDKGWLSQVWLYAADCVGGLQRAGAGQEPRQEEGQDGR